ncbi:unnamed protein product [Protopolystoma xenopodis]|uniref:Uncharacterized protein n=1 Tax=Protopolystoma xenopodis TaxID=117903 RepID=A0A448WW86_9PLAT|nr:unnamed protein product [Protopolystoma xenopodis]
MLVQFSRDTGYDHAPSVTGSIGHSSRNNISEDTSSRHYIPSSFALELDDDNDGLDTAFADHLPRLGASPGPQIPPSSPTEFLPFYSEAANKSRRRQTQGQSTPESCASADDRTSHSRIPPTSIPSSDSIGDRATGSSPLGTPPSSHDSGRERTDDPLNDDVDSALNRTLTNETHPDISRPIVDDDDDARCSQTRESFTSRGEVNTPSPPQ